jgi:electron transfer flavoprotein alpha subunit
MTYRVSGSAHYREPRIGMSMDRGAGGRHDDRALPNLLVPIDLRDGQPTEPSLFALSEGRRVAHTAGATVFAIAFADGPLPDAVADRLGRAGADKVLLCEGPGLGAPPLDATHGAALYAAAERIAPLLVLFPAGGPGRELGPGLAARLGGAFASTADLEVGAATVALADGIGRVFVRRWDREQVRTRRLDPVELERPVVAILVAGGAPADIGTAAVEVEVIDGAPPARVGLTEIASEPDDQAALALASVLVVVEPALSAAARAGLGGAAAAGVPIVDAATAAAVLADAVPRTLVTIGAPEVRVGTAPGSRVGAVSIAIDRSAVASVWNSGSNPDVVWNAGNDAPKLWAELDAALATFGSRKGEPSA